MFSSLKSDVPASIVVFLVAMPLCLGIALASGAPLFSGIIAGIVGGIVVGLLSGSPLGVSGPAAGLAVIVLHAIEELSAFDAFLMTVVLAGVMQLLLGFLRAGVIGYYFPSSVIKGMLAGIGILIILKQIPHAFGYDQSPEGELSFTQMDGNNTFTEILAMLDRVHPGAVVISVVSLAILILWERPFMKNLSWTTVIQGPLVAVIAGIILNHSLSGSYLLEGEHLVNIPVATSIGGFFDQFTFPDFTMITNTAVILIAVKITVVASLETLLCVEATDKLDPQKRVTPTNRELKAQGIGNIISGLIGGLPITQVIVRSSANIQSGGKSKMSAVIHGILLLITAMAIPNILNMVPKASLAAILLIVGYKLAKPMLFTGMFKKGWSQFLPFIVTIVGIVAFDMLKGIGLGVAVAVIHILWKNLKLPYHFYPEEHDDNEPIVVKLAEEVSFLNKASILQTLNHMPDNSVVILDGSQTRTIDQDVLEIIDDFKINAKTRGIDFRFVKSVVKETDPFKSVERINALKERRRES